MRTRKRVALWAAVVVACIIGVWVWRNAASAPPSYDVAVLGRTWRSRREWTPEWLGLQMPPFRLYRANIVKYAELWGLDTRTGKWGPVLREEGDCPATLAYCRASKELLWCPSTRAVQALPTTGGTPHTVYETPPGSMGTGLLSVHPSSPKMLIVERRSRGAGVSAAPRCLRWA